jgi:hypothetical protein
MRAVRVTSAGCQFFVMTVVFCAVYSQAADVHAGPSSPSLDFTASPQIVDSSIRREFDGSNITCSDGEVSPPYWNTEHVCSVRVCSTRWVTFDSQSGDYVIKQGPPRWRQVGATDAAECRLDAPTTIITVMSLDSLVQ